MGHPARLARVPVGDACRGICCERLKLPARLEALKAVHFPEAGTPMVELMSGDDAGASAADLRGAVLSGAGAGAEAATDARARGTAFATECEGARRRSSRCCRFIRRGAEAGAGRDCGRYAKPQPMRRLLQGDVGSGKTIVAMQAALVAIENGYQAAMMAPTEILATQHYLSARKLLGDAVSPRREGRIG
jgi:ATP-dependent DNA helicase RecG